jgi:ubiquitin-conjugating enzyme E2 G1
MERNQGNRTMPQQQPQTGAAMLLARQLKLMKNQDDIPGISVGLVDDSNVFEWEVMLMISDDCKFYGGMSLLPTS